MPVFFLIAVSHINVFESRFPFRNGGKLGQGGLSVMC